MSRPFAYCKYIYPPNAKHQDQLDIMVEMERAGKDPLAIDVIDQEILFHTDYWHVSRNRFPYEGAESHFLIAAMQPVYDIADMTPEMWDDLRKIWLKLRDEYGAVGGAFSFRFGDPSRSGASLTRLHAHVITPAPGEKVRFSISGKTALKEGLTLPPDFGPTKAN